MPTLTDERSSQYQAQLRGETPLDRAETLPPGATYTPPAATLKRSRSVLANHVVTPAHQDPVARRLNLGHSEHSVSPITSLSPDAGSSEDTLDTTQATELDSQLYPGSSSRKRTRRNSPQQLFDLAVRQGDVESATLHYEPNSDVILEHRHLVTAVANDDRLMVECLLAWNVQVNGAVDGLDDSALDVAAKSQSPRMLQFLLQELRQRYTDQSLFQALCCAVKAGQTEPIRLLDAELVRREYQLGDSTALVALLRGQEHDIERYIPNSSILGNQEILNEALRGQVQRLIEGEPISVHQLFATATFEPSVFSRLLRLGACLSEQEVTRVLPLFRLRPVRRNGLALPLRQLPEEWQVLKDRMEEHCAGSVERMEQMEPVLRAWLRDHRAIFDLQKRVIQATAGPSLRRPRRFLRQRDNRVMLGRLRQAAAEKIWPREEAAGSDQSDEENRPIPLTTEQMLLLAAPAEEPQVAETEAEAEAEAEEEVHTPLRRT